MTYEEARTALYQVSDARAAAQEGIDRSGDEVKASRSLGARLYVEGKRAFFAPKGVSIPVAVSVFPDELYEAPLTPQVGQSEPCPEAFKSAPTETVNPETD